MTRTEAMRQTHQEHTLLSLGFTRDEAEALRRISMTLHRWYERECNGDIERDGDNADGVPYASNAAWGGKHLAYRIPDRERGAEKRLRAIISARNQRVISSEPEPDTMDASIKRAFDVSVTPYLQTDPRGAVLYILRPGDVPEGAEAQSYYSRGVVVY